jgi:hypothetical protein
MARWHKRAPVEAVCGRVVGVTERQLKDVEATLTDVQGSAVFRAHSDARGKFSSQFPKATTGYMLSRRAPTKPSGKFDSPALVVQACHRKIAVSLGMSYGHNATYIEGIDKPSDLDADFKRTQQRISP